MAPVILTACSIWIGGHDFTSDLNKVSVNPEAEALDKTTFGSQGWKENAKGLKGVGASHEGFWASAESDAVDPEVFGNFGTDQPETVSPDGLAGSVAYMFQTASLKYSLFGEVGKLVPFTVDSTGSNTVGMKRGQIAKAKGTASATGALGSALELGAVGAAQFLYSTFHVFGTPGTTMTLVLESDEDNTFASATTRATIGPLTAAGGVWATRAAGAITDTWYRFRVTAITGTFTVGGAIAIGG
jgi:hypothetical protein